MNYLKKSLALLLVLAVSLSLGIPVFAAQEAGTGSITINDATPNTNYNVYRIFDLESHSGNAYSYKVRPDKTWDEFAQSIAYSETNPSGLVKISNGYVTPMYNGSPLKEIDKENWAQALIKKAKDWIGAHPSCTEDKHGTVAQDAASVTIPDLPSGYYFVDTTLGTVCFLNTVTEPSITISEKNEPPTVDKTTSDNDKNMSHDHKKSDASVGDLVKFTAAVHVKKGAVGYKLVDTMAQGLVFDNDTHPLTVDVVDSTGSSQSIPSELNYWTLEGRTGDTSFTLSFTDDFIAKQIGKDLVVTYYGKLTEDAVNFDVATNSAKIKYGDNSEFESTPSETTTYTYDLKVIKYAEENGSKIPLAGAQFQLSKSETLTGDPAKDAIKMTAAGNVYTVSPAGNVDTITTDDTGLFTIQGLDAGTYYLHEIKSPAGYNKLAAPIKICIDHNGIVTYDGTNAVTGNDFAIQQSDGTSTQVEGAVPVLNQTGSVLPSTGGIGTTIFYIVGALLMVSALVLLITRKKMSGNKNND